MHFYEDYVEFKQYISTKMNSLNNINIKKNENNMQKHSSENDKYRRESETKTLKEQIHFLLRENEKLRNDHKSHLKIIEILSINRNIEEPKNDSCWEIAGCKRKTQNSTIVQLNRMDNEHKTLDTRNRFEHFGTPDEFRSEMETISVADIPIPPLPLYKNINNKQLSLNNIIKSTRPNICITENYLRNFNPRTVPGNSSYSNIKNGKTVTIIGDSHVKRIHRKGLNETLTSGRAFFKNFDGAHCRKLSHHILPTLVDDKPDVIVIHVGCNNIYEYADPFKIANDIIRIGFQCRNSGVNEVVISSVLMRDDLDLNHITKQVNDLL